MTQHIRLIIGAAILAALIVLFFSVRGCQSARQEAGQARQDAKSADAYAGAAKEAVATVAAGADREANLDHLADQAMKEIDNAEDNAAARAAVDRALCGLHLYAQRPECAVLRAGPDNVEGGR